MPRPLALKSWAKQALYETKQTKRDLAEAWKDLEALEKSGGDEKAIERLKKRITVLKKRVAEAER